MPLLLTTMMTTGRLYLSKRDDAGFQRQHGCWSECYIKAVRPPAHGLHLHAREAEGAVSLHADDPLAFTAAAAALLHRRCSDGKTEADSHRSEGSGIQPGRT